MQVQTSEQTFFNFLILETSRFPPKKFYNIDYWSPFDFDNLSLFPILSFFFLFILHLLLRRSKRGDFEWEMELTFLQHFLISFPSFRIQQKTNEKRDSNSNYYFLLLLLLLSCVSSWNCILCGILTWGKFYLCKINQLIFLQKTKLISNKNASANQGTHVRIGKFYWICARLPSTPEV